jgi:hypothetical protein
MSMSKTATIRRYYLEWTCNRVVISGDNTPGFATPEEAEAYGRQLLQGAPTLEYRVLSGEPYEALVDDDNKGE